MKSHDGVRVVSRLNVLRRTLRRLCLLAAIWAVVVAATGGFYFRIGQVPVSSRRPWTALLVAIAGLVVESRVARRLGEQSLLAAGWQRVRSWYEQVELRWRVWARHQYVEWSRRLWPRFQHVGSLVIGLAAVGLNVAVWLTAPPFWLDEETIALNVRDRGFAELGGTLWFGQSAPLGWLVLERATLLALGTSEAAMRAVPLLFGIALIAAALWFGRRWMGSLGTAALVLLCAFGPYLVHYRFEVKHYTADAFWALLLPALAVWAIEGDSPRRRLHRLLIWWTAAAVGLWLANGALLVTPGVALLLVVIMWRRHGRRAAMTTIALGGIWLAFFVTHYEWSIRPALQSQHLHNFWAEQLAPASDGPIALARWVVARFPMVAMNPGGTGLWVTLWASAITGFACSRHPFVGLVYASVPITALALSPTVPMHERLALWIVPALYVGVALLVDRAAQLCVVGVRRRQWLLAATAASVLIVESFLLADVLGHGRDELVGARWSDAKHSLNDRLAVRWLMRQHRPGDVLISTRLAWPAVRWYGGIRALDAPDGRMRDGSLMYEASYQADPGCLTGQLRDTLASHHRVLVYLGFRDVPDGFDDLLLERLDELGAVVDLQEFAGLSRAAVLDLHVAGSEEITFRLLSRRKMEESVPLGGCITIQRAVLW
ncbi:MAG TPA: hypothetical protein VES67_03770 [Vicinamibacterales bacterium]|nr:hypothetical protein [Vicinamibacterales bacterium]